jgi:hypothetical protein
MASTFNVDFPLDLQSTKILGRKSNTDPIRGATARSPRSGLQIEEEPLEITVRDFVTVLHGMGFGALFMLAFSGALAELYRMSFAAGSVQAGARGQMLLNGYLIAMVVLAWLTVFSGAYIVYPWYRAVPPAGLTDLSEYPRRLLLSSGRTSEWHNVGMEWKEHVSWLAPIAMTMVAYVAMKYQWAITRPRRLRTAVLVFTVAAFVATGVAGAFGAFLNKYAPVRGGSVIILMEGEK